MLDDLRSDADFEEEEENEYEYQEAEAASVTAGSWLSPVLRDPQR